MKKKKKMAGQGHFKENSQKKALVQQTQTNAQNKTKQRKLYSISGRIYIPTIQDFVPERWQQNLLPFACNLHNNTWDTRFRECDIFWKGPCHIVLSLHVSWRRWWSWCGSCSPFWVISVVVVLSSGIFDQSILRASPTAFMFSAWSKTHLPEKFTF